MTNATAIDTKKDIEFDVHKNVIKDLIHSQNGTLATAVRELVMNSIDAQATEIKITLTSTGFVIIDNGKGFASREDVETNFRVFGQPHEEGDAIYGRFRIGRGQVMSLASTVWESNYWTMDVDVEKRGFSFRLREHEDTVHAGCKITGKLYRPIDDHTFADLCSCLRKLVRYCDIPTSLNGHLINKTVKEEAWDVDEDDFRIRWQDDSGVEVYNLGVFVKEIHSYNTNVGAVIMTKRPLRLNMARNEVSDRDPLWAKIWNVIQKKGREKTRSKLYSKRPTARNRRSIIHQLVHGKLEEGVVIERLPLLADVRGHSLTLQQIIENRRVITICPRKEKSKGEALATRDDAYVLDEKVCQEWGQFTNRGKIEDVLELFKLLWDVARANGNDFLAKCIENLEGVRFEDIAKDISDEKIEVQPKDLTAEEKVALSALQRCSTAVSNALSRENNEWVQMRNVFIGQSNTAVAWTDGWQRIWIERRQLPLLKKPGNAGGVTLSLHLLHEYIHNVENATDVDHDFDFYKRYHDLSAGLENVVAKGAHALEKAYLRGLKKKGLGLPKKVIEEHKELGALDERREGEADSVTRYTLYCKEGINSLSRLDALLLKKVFGWAPRKHSKAYAGRTVYVLNAKAYTKMRDDLYAHARSLDATIPEEIINRRWESVSQQTIDEGVIPALCSAYNKKLGTTEAIWRQLTEAKSIEDVLVAIVGTEGSALQGAQRPGDKEWLVTDKVIECHEIGEGVTIGGWHWDMQGLWDKEERLHKAERIMQYAMSILRDPSERAQLASMLLSEKGAKRLFQALPEPDGDSVEFIRR